MKTKRELRWLIVCLLIGLFGVCSTAWSQSIARKTLTWKATQVTNSQTQSAKGMTCDFITKSNTSVVWVQKDGALKTTFSVTAVEGDWPDIGSPGSIIYTIERDGKSCKMRLERGAGGIFITLDFGTTNLRFNIDSVDQ